MMRNKATLSSTLSTTLSLIREGLREGQSDGQSGEKRFMGSLWFAEEGREFFVGLFEFLGERSSRGGFVRGRGCGWRGRLSQGGEFLLVDGFDRLGRCRRRSCGLRGGEAVEDSVGGRPGFGIATQVSGDAGTGGSA